MASHTFIADDFADGGAGHWPKNEDASASRHELARRILSTLDEASRADAPDGAPLDHAEYGRLIDRLRRMMCQLQRGYAALEAENQQLRGRLSRTPPADPRSNPRDGASRTTSAA